MTPSSILVVGEEDQVLPQFAKYEFTRYFQELSDDKWNLKRKLFKLSAEKVPYDCQYEFLGLKTDLEERDMFDE